MARKKTARQRRRRGEGSVYQRKDGRWVNQITVRGKTKWIYGATYDEVKEAGDELKGDVVKGVPLITGKRTTEDFLTEWLASVKRSARPKTYISYEMTVRVHIVPVIGKVPLLQLSVLDVERVLDECASKPRTCSYAHTVLRRALNTAVRKEYVRRNVALLVDPPKYEKPEIDPFHAEEFNTFLDAISEHDYRAMFLLGATLGLRKGEVTGLPWSNVEFRGDANDERRHVVIRVVQTLQRIEGALRILPVKTKKSRRVLVGGTELYEALKAYRRVQLKWKMQTGAAWENEHDLVFTTRIGTPFDGRNVLRMQHQILKKAGLRIVSFHALRHQAASDMIDAGMDDRKVMEIMGHSSIRVTKDIYVAPRITDDDIDTLNRMAQRRDTSRRRHALR